ncbi:branched-chain amino acid ABC transporter permease [Rhizobium sp. CECT 9324]|uniref:branched-chain amino acid ABC transporter permease n=1 Tax=Rhizobium sp. CECT 9324 TaxID=2845820 RepID=UPI001E2B7649|nr:branched-chain amino acid ABC transporter permease [Rhizobium sp. CECT 9324]CAH0340233.1 High-affinity branched-chain amino acid transport system permease protein LivH [Rhizobium sp. CECT 9324]
MAYLLQQLLNALPIAALYACLAFGYSIAFGVTRRADITYGALFAFAGQICLLFTDIGWNAFTLVFPAALGFGLAVGFSYTVFAGWTFARHVMRPLHRGSPNAVIVASLAVVLLLSETARLALDTRTLWLPPMGNQRIIFAEFDDFSVSLTIMQCVHIAIMLAIIAAGQLLLATSRAGRLWQAVSQDPAAARLCGVDADLVFVLSLVAASVTAAAAGLSATTVYGTMDFGAGMMFGLKVVLIAAAGGISVPLRSALGAAAVGLAETLWSGYGAMAWRDAVIISALIAVLVFSRRERVIP